MAFPLNQTITLRTSATLIRYSVLKAFAPFTLSAVLLVQEEKPDFSPQILKIFDPRYTVERISLQAERLPSRLWSPSLEQEAAQLREAVLRGEVEDTFDCHLVWADEPEERAAQHQRALLCEEYFFRTMQHCYEAEIQAYERLEEFQGKSTPRFYHQGTAIYEDERPFEPSAIVIEYIHGHSLEQIPLSNLTPLLYQPILDLADRLHEYGIIHYDLRASNVLFTPYDKPTRAVIIDFGNAGYRREEHSDEEWKEGVEIQWDAIGIRIELEKKGVVLYSDPSQRPYHFVL